MASEWAKQKATRIVDGVAFDEGCIEECIGDIATNLDAARAQGRREGLEEAEMAAEALEIEYDQSAARMGCTSIMAGGARGVRRAIRALIEQEPAEKARRKA